MRVDILRVPAETRLVMEGRDIQEDEIRAFAFSRLPVMSSMCKAFAPMQVAIAKAVLAGSAVGRLPRL